MRRLILNLEGYIFNETITKSGKKILLRSPSRVDAKKMIEYFNVVAGESSNLLFGENEFRLSISEEEGHIEKINIDEGSCIIIGLIDDQIIAVAQLVRLKRKRISHNSNFSISVKKEYWGEGIGTLILEEIIKYAKSSQTITNIHLSVNSENSRAISLYKKFGFEKVGVHKKYICIDGTFYDEVLMDLSL